MESELTRSPALMNQDDTALLVVDLQEKLLPLIPRHAHIVWNTRRLIDAAELLNVAMAATEQYPQGLGATTSQIASRFEVITDKRSFSCCGDQTFLETVVTGWREQSRFKVLVAGIETHVCVQQTVLDLLAEGFQVYVAADAVGARGTTDHDVALQRMDSAGATLTTTEAAIFEWCQTSDADCFKQISGLIREHAPA